MPEQGVKTPTFDRDSIGNTLFIAIGVSLICSVLVTASVTLLRPLQLENEFRFKHRVTVLQLAGLYEAGADLDILFEPIEQRMIELDSGEYTDAVSFTGFDLAAAANDESLSEPIPEDEDDAELKRRSKYAPVSLVMKDGRLDQVIFPIYGNGMWSTIHAYLAVDADGRTVRGLRIYDHGETPGIGDLYQRPDWYSQWPGKLIYDDRGRSQIGVGRGSGLRDRFVPYQVDGISGATVTGRGLRDMLSFWTGPLGYKAYLERLQAEAEDDG